MSGFNPRSLHQLTRRTFLHDLGFGVFAIAVIGPIAAACSTGDNEDPTSTTSTTASAAATAGGTAASSTSSTTSASTTGPLALEAVTLQRVDLGNVSAYALIRSGEAAVVDTGNPGDVGALEAGFAEVGIGWGAVGHVILTHLHGDHIGSLSDVMSAADQATGYAGEADIPAMDSPRPLTAVGDDDEVFGLQIIETPGHTAGHVAVLDPVGGLLLAGDAMNGSEGGVIGANPRFTEDMDLANESIKKLATYTFDTVAFGHGEPVVGNASAQVTALAATL